jgi:hypothetical protein
MIVLDVIEMAEVCLNVIYFGVLDQIFLDQFLKRHPIVNELGQVTSIRLNHVKLQLLFRGFSIVNIIKLLLFHQEFAF